MSSGKKLFFFCYSRRTPLNHRGMSELATHPGSPKRNKAFHNALPGFIDSIAANPRVADIPGLKEWIKKILEYNLVGGKAMRGLSVVMAYELLERPEKLTEQSMKLAYTLGWCCEMFQSYLVILDDIMDGSTTRRGQPCWYLVPGVGVGKAINDAIILQNSMFYALRENFGKKSYYPKMLDLINETMLYASFGQFLDCKTSSIAKDYSQFTAERHKTIVTYKTAFYTYDMPCYLGALLAEYKVDEATRKQMQDISLDMGVLFQIQDDYLDCYGDESATGKAGTDLQEGKCSWLAVNALERCSESQRIVFNTCYGSNQFAHIDRIKRLYDQLRLPALYNDVERRYYDEILAKILELPSDKLQRLFQRYLDITYRRRK